MSTAQRSILGRDVTLLGAQQQQLMRCGAGAVCVRPLDVDAINAAAAAAASVKYFGRL